MNKVVVIDYGMGNTDSVLRALEECGGKPILSNSKSDFETASHLILPGVGSFQIGMNNINNLGIIPILEEQVFKHRIPFLGICMGMQLLADKGFENGEYFSLQLRIMKMIFEGRERMPKVWSKIWKKIN